jgi:hypothetical protein
MLKSAIDRGMTSMEAMKRRIALAVFAGTVLVSASAFAGCPPPPAPSAHQKDVKDHGKAQKPSDGCVDLNGLPQISEHIAATAPAAAASRAAPSAPATTAPDNNLLDKPGLAVGLAKPDPAVRPIPTVGYRWSLD